MKNCGENWHLTLSDPPHIETETVMGQMYAWPSLYIYKVLPYFVAKSPVTLTLIGEYVRENDGYKDKARERMTSFPSLDMPLHTHTHTQV